MILGKIPEKDVLYMTFCLYDIPICLAYCLRIPGRPIAF